ncbi:electron transport complex subunit RsxC [Methylophilus aquaticus]|uniref:electron transport complex subunit RsxC n=1 Tax=Methylophilus aquaticus TaxID=1971610 RepID=UPI002795289F|nr:electron transport complex subunit RsxC [Methylophilus aquaticus]
MNAIIQFTQKLNGIFKFHGGVHPPGNKSSSTQAPIADVTLPALLTLPLRQHVGHLPKVKIQVGEHVLKGQLLAEAEGAVSAAIHAPTSGTIVAIEEAVIPHPSSLPDYCIRLQPDGKDAWVAHTGQDWRNTERSALIQSLTGSGIVGMGGATFPTQIKLRTDGKSNIHTLVINAAECEPYISCDDMLMRERADGIVQGVLIAQHLMSAEKVVIGIEDNKPLAIAAMQEAVKNTDIQVKIVPTLYPSGDARRLVYLLLGQEIAHDKRSTQEGIQVFNVATMLALHRYFDHGEPSISRIVTITGNVAQPQNFEVLFGTPVSHLLAAAGGVGTDTSHYIMGGPMMGFDLPDANVPVTKASNCIIAASPGLFPSAPPAMPCIRCTRCADACPVSLQPQELYWFAKSDNFEKARDYDLFDCIECGACSYVCPSHIPLVQYYRYAKSEIIATDKAKEAADLARERNEARLARIEREKQERAQKHAERAQGAKKAAEKMVAAADSDQAQTGATADEAKKAAIAAAIARAKAQKEAQAATGEAPKNMAAPSASVQQEIADIDARRAAVGLSEADSPAMQDADKQAKIAAAIAKAKAAKAAAQTGHSATSATSAVVDPEKQAKTDPAIARARAAKAAAEASKNVSELAAPQLTTTASADQEKQAKIAAAIARAKAAKAAAEAAKIAATAGNTDDAKE